MHSTLAIAAAAVLAVLFGLQQSRAADAFTLEAAAGDFDREDVLAIAALPSPWPEGQQYELTRTDNGQSVPVQIQGGKRPSVAWIIREKLVAGQTRRYRLAPAAKSPAAAAGVIVADDGKQVTVKVGDKPVLVYNQAVVPSPDPKHPEYAKSGYMHPVYDPSGRMMSDDFNPDHPHQHGIMFAWRMTTFEGRSTNGWDQLSKLGRVEHVRLESIASGPVFGSFTALLRQVDLTAPGGPKPAFNETWFVRVHNLSDRFLFDIEAVQTCAGDAPVTVDEMHYGGLMIRGHADWQRDKTFDYLTSDGKTKLDGNNTRPSWVDLYGPIAGTVSGAAILDHPSNFRFPQPARLHPTMPYFCYTPALLGAFKIEPGKPYVWRYRFCIHDGKLDPGAAQRLWQDYAHPPVVRVAAE